MLPTILLGSLELVKTLQHRERDGHHVPEFGRLVAQILLKDDVLRPDAEGYDSA
jgi:hypothetical protein